MLQKYEDFTKLPNKSARNVNMGQVPFIILAESSKINTRGVTGVTEVTRVWLCVGTLPLLVMRDEICSYAVQPLDRSQDQDIDPSPVPCNL